MKIYYNDNDAQCVAWLKELIAQGILPKGDVDERNIRLIKPTDLDGYDQCHFFAGIGGWAYALQLAGCSGPVWTGSCPCQPFSAAGQRKGVDDPRHLWPDLFRLIAECRPPTIFGEQVASKDGREWLARVRADLESVAYAVGGADLCAAGVGAPHIRQRLYWVADAAGERRHGGESAAGSNGRNGFKNCGAVSRMADADSGLQGDRDLQRSGQHRQQPQDGFVSRMGDADDTRPQGRRERSDEHTDQRTVEPSGFVSRMAVSASEQVGRAGQSRTLSAWDAFDILQCTDGKARRIEPGTFPLAHGIPARVGRLRGYGNAIVPQVAAEFVSAFMECRAEEI